MAHFNDVVNSEETTSANANAYSVDTAVATIVNYTYSDVDFKFQEETDFVLVVNDASLVNSIWTMLNTSQGERVMEPEFGVKMDRFLFENITRDLEQIILVQLERGFERWDSRVKIKNVILLSRRGGDGNKISVQIDIQVPGLSTTTPVYITQPGIN